VSRPNSANSAATAANKKASSMARINDGPGVKVEGLIHDFSYLNCFYR
jgi:transcriptional adapter 2-alpha